MRKLVLFVFAILMVNIGVAQVFQQKFSCSEDIADYFITESSGDNQCLVDNRFDFISDFFKIENEAIVWEKQSNLSKVPASTQVISRTTNILENADFLTVQFKLKIAYTHTGAGADAGQIYFYLGDGSTAAWGPTSIASRPPTGETSVFYNFLLNISTNSAKFRLGGDTQLFDGEQLITILLNRSNDSKTYNIGGGIQVISAKTSHIWIGNTQIVSGGTKTIGEVMPKKFKIYIEEKVRDSRLEIDDIKIWDNNIYAELPVLMSWNLSGNNANNGNNYVNATNQSAALKNFNASSSPIQVTRGAGLIAGALSNSFAASFKESDVNPDYATAVANDAYYAIPFQGNATDYTQILGYKVKIRRTDNSKPATITKTKWVLVLGDSNNAISENSEWKILDNTDIEIIDNTSNPDGVYYTLKMNENDASIVVPPGKNAELRLYLWGNTAYKYVLDGAPLVPVFGLGRLSVAASSTADYHLQIYGKSLTAGEYATLPVSLVSFNAFRLDNNAVQLKWNTLSEKNNVSFSVLRAGDNKEFKVINTVKGNGTTNEVHTYGFIDYEPYLGINYYKLVQTDNDGVSRDLGDIQQVLFGMNKNKLMILQDNNSTSEIKVLYVADKQVVARIYVRGLLGEIIYESDCYINKGYNEITVPKSLTHGVYTFQLKVNGESQVVKFIK